MEQLAERCECSTLQGTATPCRHEDLLEIHAALTVALEGVRCGSVQEEEAGLAAAVVGALAFASRARLKIAQALEAKIAYNRTRSDHKTEQRQKAGGKQF